MFKDHKFTKFPWSN